MRWRAYLIGALAALGGAAAILAVQVEPRQGEAVPTGPTPAQQVDAGLARLFADSQAIGMVVAVVRDDGETEVRGFGHRAPNDPRPPDGRTLVRLQSVSKLFAADLLAAKVAEGELKLDDPLSRFARLSEALRTKAASAQPITLVSLATHISGLPRDDHVKHELSEGQAAAARQQWLAQQPGLFPPGRQAQYSNAAYDLLGDVLARAGRASYVDELAATITKPLGMVDTTPSPTADECARMMAPDPGRHPFPCVDQSGEAASGGLYSTADDMALWLKAQLAPGAVADRRRISQAVYVQRATLKKAIGLDHAGPANAIGLGWIEQLAAADHPRILEKTGGGDGFLVYVAIDPARHVGVFVAFDNVVDHRLGFVTGDVNALAGLLGARPNYPPR